MEKLENKLLLLIFISLNAFAQKNDITKDTLFINFNKNLYLIIAKDSIKKLYNAQQDLIVKNVKLQTEAISLNYKFNNLNFVSIPTYRIKRDAFKEYNCESNIEYFIQFNEFNKYQDVLVKKDKTILSKISVPNFDIEIERINNPTGAFFINKQMYEDFYLKKFLYFKDENFIINKIFNARKENFFFNIFGIKNILFEIDSSDNLIYANEIWYPEERERLPINEFIRKYIGQNIIKEFAKGYYEDIDNIGTLIEKPCDNIKISSKKVFVKIIN
jgi:hypothetical protein